VATPLDTIKNASPRTIALVVGGGVVLGLGWKYVAGKRNTDAVASQPQQTGTIAPVSSNEAPQYENQVSDSLSGFFGAFQDSQALQWDNFGSLIDSLRDEAANREDRYQQVIDARFDEITDQIVVRADPISPVSAPPAPATPVGPRYQIDYTKVLGNVLPGSVINEQGALLFTDRGYQYAYGDYNYYGGPAEFRFWTDGKNRVATGVTNVNTATGEATWLAGSESYNLSGDARDVHARV
jgi:hypothetical protein